MRVGWTRECTCPCERLGVRLSLEFCLNRYDRKGKQYKARAVAAFIARHVHPISILVLSSFPLFLLLRCFFHSSNSNRMLTSLYELWVWLSCFLFVFIFIQKIDRVVTWLVKVNIFYRVV